MKSFKSFWKTWKSFTLGRYLLSARTVSFLELHCRNFNFEKLKRWVLFMWSTLDKSYFKILMWYTSLMFQIICIYSEFGNLKIYAERIQAPDYPIRFYSIRSTKRLTKVASCNLQIFYYIFPIAKQILFSHDELSAIFSGISWLFSRIETWPW
jgi:hypothetical protein